MTLGTKVLFVRPCFAMDPESLLLLWDRPCAISALSALALPVRSSAQTSVGHDSGISNVNWNQHNCDAELTTTGGAVTDGDGSVPQHHLHSCKPHHNAQLNVVQRDQGWCSELVR